MICFFVLFVDLCWKLVYHFLKGNSWTQIAAFDRNLTSWCVFTVFHQQEEPVSGSKPVKSQGSGCGGASVSNGCPATRSTLERLCQARRARRAARRLREQQRQGPKVPSNLDILERHTREVLRRLEVGPLEEVSLEEQSVFTELNVDSPQVCSCGLKDGLSWLRVCTI